MLKSLLVIALLAGYGVSIAGAISSGVGNRPANNFVYSKVDQSSASYLVEMAYSYDGEKPISLSFSVPERGTADMAKGEMVIYESYSKGKVSKDPMFLGFRVAARHILSNKNNFMWLSMEFNKIVGVVSAPLNIVKVDVSRAASIGDRRQRLSYVASLPRVDMPVPILAEESGVFYLPVKLDKEIINYNKGKLSLKIRIKKAL